MTLPSNNGGSGTSKKKQTAVAVLIVIIIFAVIVGYRAYSNNVEKLEAESDKKVEEALKDVTNTKDGEPIQGPFTIEIISCSKDGYGYMDIKGSITNNWDFTLATDIIITGNDRNGDIVLFKIRFFDQLSWIKQYCEYDSSPNLASMVCLSVYVIVVYLNTAPCYLWVIIH